MAHRLWFHSDADVPMEDPTAWTLGVMPIVPPTVIFLLFPSVTFVVSVVEGEVCGVCLKEAGFGLEAAVTRTWMRENKYTGRPTKKELTSNCDMTTSNQGPDQFEREGGDSD